MAYNVYFACDKCGNEGMAWCNHSVSLSICTKLADMTGSRNVGRVVDKLTQEKMLAMRGVRDYDAG